ncbi:MAG: glycosyltransferase family 2 protein [Lachnospiraceae bacterium]|nr:glycosyltransferase family 2 protein [Lachnospiraceae bacterium]
MRNDEKPLISVIIPVYNVEKYLRRCVKSVLSQTYKNLEVLLIDDGSTDRSPDICDELAKKDKRIRVIHQENRGVASTRNNGVRAASGDLIAFIDSDDFVTKDYLDVLYQDMVNTGSDIAVCSMKEVYEEWVQAHKQKRNSKTRKKDSPSFIEICCGYGKYNQLFNENKILTISPCCKLYKSKVFDGINYPDGLIHEDEYVAHHILSRADKVSYDSRIGYLYYKGNDEKCSITQNRFSIKRLDALPALEDRIKFMESIGDKELIKKAYLDFLKRVQYYYYGVKYNYPEKYELYQKIFNDYRKHYEQCEKYLSMKHKIQFLIFLKFPVINFHLKNILGRKSIST